MKTAITTSFAGTFFVGLMMVVWQVQLYTPNSLTLAGNLSYNTGVFLTAACAVGTLIGIRKWIVRNVRPAIFAGLLGLPAGIAAPGFYYNPIDIMIAGIIFPIMCWVGSQAFGSSDDSVGVKS